MLDDITVREFLRVDYPRVVAAVALVSGSYPAAEDAVQEALLRAWIRSERGEHIESLNRWVVTAALNLARSGLRRIIAERKARRRLEGASRAVAPPTTDRLDIERALATLPRRQRETVVLRYYLDMDTKEVAAALGISEGTVKSSLARARTALANKLRLEDVEVTTHHAEP